MDLETSKVHRNLDAKIKILGLDAPDLIFVLILAAVMNLFFGSTSFAAVMVLGVPLIFLGIIYFSKKGKPDGYMVHLVRYLITPGIYQAGEELKHETKMKDTVYE